MQPQNRLGGEIFKSKTTFVMTQQYVGHMTEDRYGWIAQLVGHCPGTWSSDSSFTHFVLLCSVFVVSRRADVGCETFPSFTTFY
jgi:hypothetical protein